jgi:hypothetical protein
MVNRVSVTEFRDDFLWRSPKFVLGAIHELPLTQISMAIHPSNHKCLFLFQNPWQPQCHQDDETNYNQANAVFNCFGLVEWLLHEIKCV